MGTVDPADPSRLVPVPAQYERTHHRSITEKTIQYFTEDLKALGFKGESFKDLDPDTEGFHNFTGKNVEMWCSHKSHPDGVLREEWSVARAVGSLEVKPLERKKVRELDNLFGKHLMGLKVASVAEQAAPGGGLDISDDDVPF
jgi:hypothetical protein